MSHVDKYSTMPDPQAILSSTIKAFKAHTSLNADLWDENDHLRLDVRVAMLRCADAFMDFLDVQRIEIKDVIFTGSNAAFNYNRFSDIDIHLVTDFSATSCPNLAENLFKTKKLLWSNLHDVEIKGCTVEMYVEDVSNPVTANGIYSLLHGKWVSKPSKRAPEWDDSAILAKTEAWADRIDAVISAKDKKATDTLFAKLTKMRQSGLSDDGEFSVENMTYKALRNLGLLDRLFKAGNHGEDRFLTLETEE